MRPSIPVYLYLCLASASSVALAFPILSSRQDSNSTPKSIRGLNGSAPAPTLSGVPNVTVTLPPGMTPTPENDPFFPFYNSTAWAAAHNLPMAQSPPGTQNDTILTPGGGNVGRDVNARELWTKIIARMPTAEGELTSRSDGTPGLKKRRNPRKDINHSKSPSPNH